MSKQQLRTEDPELSTSVERAKEMLALAARLRESMGTELDDAAISAVAEATGTDPDYVRLALASSTSLEGKRASLWMRVVGTFKRLDAKVRTMVISGWLAALYGAAGAFGLAGRDQYGLGGILQILAVAGAAYAVGSMGDRRTSTIGGAVFGATAFVSYAVFAWALSSPNHVESSTLIVYAIVGALGGHVVHRIFRRNEGRLGIKDPQKERQELLQQLHDIQDKLRSGQQNMTFLSLDVVSSTAMKAEADPLSVEFTFTEYHRYVEIIVDRHGGQIHSTAGDGVIAAFESPSQAMMAAKNLQAGLMEFNTLRNRLRRDLKLRCGIHSGVVVAPDRDNIRSVNFAHVIDMAAHLQKVCPEGGIAISDAAAMYLPGGPSAVGTMRIEVQDVAGVVWLPRSLQTDGRGGSIPPPLH